MAYRVCLRVCLRDCARRGRKNGRSGLMNLHVSEMSMANFQSCGRCCWSLTTVVTVLVEVTGGGVMVDVGVTVAFLVNVMGMVKT